MMLYFALIRHLQECVMNEQRNVWEEHETRTFKGIFTYALCITKYTCNVYKQQSYCIHSLHLF